MARGRHVEDAIAHQLVRELRIKANLTQEEVARRLRRTQGTYSKLENGVQRLQFRDVVHILDAFGESLVDFAKAFESRRRSEMRRAAEAPPRAGYRPRGKRSGR